jgi:hypothetical protein
MFFLCMHDLFKVLQLFEEFFFDEYRRFLLMDHPFLSKSKHPFNGLEENMLLHTCSYYYM